MENSTKEKKEYNGVIPTAQPNPVTKEVAKPTEKQVVNNPGITVKTT